MMKKLDEKLTKADILKRTYKLLELEYTQGVKTSVSDLAKRNGIKPGTLQTRAKRDGWRKKREEYLENLASAKTGHLTGEAFSDLLRKMTSSKEMCSGLDILVKGSQPDHPGAGGGDRGYGPGLL